MDINMLNPYVRRITRRSFEAPHSTKERYLFDYDLLLVEGGEARIKIEGEDYIAKAGDAVFLPPNVRHSFHVETGEFHQFFIHFDPVYTEFSMIRTISYDSPESVPKVNHILFQENIFEDMNIPYVFRPNDFDELLSCFGDIKSAVQNNNSLVVKTKMLKLLHLILSQFGDRDKPEADIVEAVREYIDSAASEPIALDMLSEQFGINKFTLERRFKERYGEGVMAYYNGKRLSLAKRYLEEGEASVTEISERLSFADIYTFSRFFKARVGMSPRAYRAKKIEG
ncbi:MAG: helix-turn-helix transcriptional regulator [Clostridia bacterium]|nr:helix-turn-helix transcriptional regulator [Clostridia bacterium]